MHGLMAPPLRTPAFDVSRETANWSGVSQHCGFGGSRFGTSAVYLFEPTPPEFLIRERRAQPTKIQWLRGHIRYSGNFCRSIAMHLPQPGTLSRVNSQGLSSKLASFHSGCCWFIRASRFGQSPSITTISPPDHIHLVVCLISRIVTTT